MPDKPNPVIELVRLLDVIRVEGTRGDGCWVPPYYVIDTTHADPETNYPGGWVSEHATIEEARVGQAQTILDAITPMIRYAKS